jgi:hypothetical protein
MRDKQMITKSTSNSLLVVCLLTTGLYTDLANAKWYVNQDEGYYKPQEYYNDKFGDFPPKDIDSKIMKNTVEVKPLQKETEPVEQTESNATSTYEPEPNTAPNSSDQNYQQPSYGNYGQQNYNQNYYTPGAGYPPNNTQRSGFSGPWNNNGSNFSNPWNNNGSNFSGPWNNNGSNFTGPWNNNGSSFSMPWGNNGSGFSPWGNNRRR